MCIFFIRRSINQDTLIEILIFAYNFNIDLLIEACIDYVNTKKININNYKEISTLDFFSDLRERLKNNFV